MKNLKFLSFGILMVSMSLTSCKKDADLQQQQAAPLQNNQKVFEKSLKVYNADKTTSMILRFSAASKELLNDIDNSEFTLAETPEATDQAQAGIPATKTTTGDEGSANYSDKDARILDAGSLPNASQPIAGLPNSSQLNAGLPNSSQLNASQPNSSQLNSTNEKPVLPEDGIQISFPEEMKTKSFSIEVKTKGLSNATTGSLVEPTAAAYYSSKFYYISGWHRIKVTNLMSNSPIRVYFYNYYYGWHYSGYTFLLNYYGSWARYQYCSRTVGARVYYYYYHSYRVNYYSSCL